MAQTLSALLIVIAMIALLRYVAIRSGLADKAVGGKRLQVLDQCALSTRQRICIVEADERRFLVGVSEAGINLLDRLPDQTKPADEAADERIPMTTGHRMRLLSRALFFGCLFLALAPLEAMAQLEDSAMISLGINGATAPEEISGALEIVALLTIVSVAPSILLMTTCFTRIVIVLGFLRQAIGIQSLPPSQVLVGLAFFITLFVMAPVGQEIKTNAYDPYVAKEIDAGVATERAMAPLRAFMASHTRETDLDLFLELSGHESIDDFTQVSITNLLPAFMLSELRTAFEIGFMIYLPFLVIDLIVASLLISMGMIVLPPIVISLPFKLMLFVLMDGWNRVVGSLVDGLI